MNVFTRANLSRFSLSELRTISKLFPTPVIYKTKNETIESIISNNILVEGKRIPICVRKEGNILHYRYIIILD